MNKYVIKLIKDKQLLYRSIYFYSLVKLETLKVFIKIYLKTEFIRISKFYINILILFNKIHNRFFCLYINY